MIAPDGTRVRGSTRDDFSRAGGRRRAADCVFDAAATPASIALLLDDSPSIYHELGETREAARSLTRSLGPEDEVAVAAFADQTHLLLPFSRDRTLLAGALASPTLTVVANSSQSFIYQAIYITAHELFRDRAGRKAIVLLTRRRGQRSGPDLGSGQHDAAARSASRAGFRRRGSRMAAQGIELYVISTEGRPRAMTDAWLAEHSASPW